MEEKMKYSVYRITDDASARTFDELVDHHLVIRDGVYLFYKHQPSVPDVVYPIEHFWIMKEES